MNTALKIYVSSSSKHAGKWKEMRASGLNIISTWIDTLAVRQNNGQCNAIDFSTVAESCVKEINRSDVLLLYSENDDVLLQPLFEAGAALALNIPVFYVGSTNKVGVLFSSHPRWRSFSDLNTALKDLEKTR